MAETRGIDQHNYLHEVQGEARADSPHDDDRGQDDITLSTLQLEPTIPSLIALSSPNLSEEDSRHRSSLRLLLARMYLIQCGVLQNIICGVDAVSRSMPEREDKRETRRANRDQHYERMHTLALQANALARKETVRDLKMRSEFWLGRSCGGKDDDETALNHFHTAKRLDSSYVDRSSDNNVRPRPNLLPTEKAVLDELISYCMRRVETRAEKDEKLNKRASKRMEKHGISSDICMVQDSARGPVWAFDHERNLEWAKQRSEHQPNVDSQSLQSVPEAPKPTSQAEEAITQAEKSASHAGQPDLEAKSSSSQSPKLSQVSGSSPPALHRSESTSRPLSQTPESTEQPPKSVAWADQPVISGTTHEIAENIAAGTAKKRPPRRSSSFRRKTSLPRRGTRGSARSVNMTNGDNSSPPLRPKLGRRDTRGSVNSAWTISSDASSSSPKVRDLAAELAGLADGWEEYDGEKDEMEEGDQSEEIEEDSMVEVMNGVTEEVRHEKEIMEPLTKEEMKYLQNEDIEEEVDEESQRNLRKDLIEKFKWAK